ncbi:AAA-ATPase [Gordonia phage Ohgeesy]|uniref:AAA-ATPase n=1 Tax=Gordonia phage Ohgeesy TaxID=2762412 RepID=A0A7G8LGE1_9CAUD|nr:AAA-ATPase [Gordonia phage Ohgeesy]QNJ56313.1 AAA-ATPase [Gordonia phage Ohgeesy]
MTTMACTRTRNIVELTGDHRSGKTETLIRVAIADALSGRRVLFATFRWTVARNTFERVANEIDNDSITRVRRSSGNLRIDLVNGGLIDVRAVTTTGHRGIDVDTVILDDAHEYEQHVESAMWCAVASPNPRVYIARVG